MADVVDALVLDLLEWVGVTPRPYPEVMEAWRTSCPRLPVWEDANDRGFIERHHERGRGEVVSVSASGLEYLRQHRTQPATT
jgi:D-3-phosphoglycerate dehydrogenase